MSILWLLLYKLALVEMHLFSVLNIFVIEALDFPFQKKEASDFPSPQVQLVLKFTT
jgi:hypothetical protein